VWCHVRTTASETEALALPVREFGTVYTMRPANTWHQL